jgi:hypothetical protein
MTVGLVIAVGGNMGGWVVAAIGATAVLSVTMPHPVVLHGRRGRPRLRPRPAAPGHRTDPLGTGFTAPDGQRVRRQVVAEFTWGLLQRTAAGATRPDA